MDAESTDEDVFCDFARSGDYDLEVWSLLCIGLVLVLARRGRVGVVACTALSVSAQSSQLGPRSSVSCVVCVSRVSVVCLCDEDGHNI